jgi:hypothetical protein
MKRILIITTIALGTLMIQPQAGPITRILMGEKMEKAASQKTTTPTQKAPSPETNPISTKAPATAPVVKTDTDFDDSKTKCVALGFKDGSNN